ncbi:MAG: fumC [Burkholderiaceae bacterium]|nr:fumC [Burkholderiaceae bacterium]
MNNTRIESDSMGQVRVANDKLWGAQTQRSLEHFQIGREQFVWSASVVRALGWVKKAAALSNRALGQMPAEIADAIVTACDEVIAGQLNAHFPLVIFQTGSGTQTNMNANEVIANRAIQLLGGTLGSKNPVHPNDHVNRSQSSNDVFPTVMHVAIAHELFTEFLPKIATLRQTFFEQSEQFMHIVKTGRTHLQDAAPLTLGQEFSAWVAQLDGATDGLRSSAQSLYPLAIGGTAVGTGLNAPAQFGALCAQQLAQMTGQPFTSAPNKFVALSAHDNLASLSAQVRTLAGALLKIANDIRWLASGPRCGIGEIHIPDNEPGSSIMPAKVNPTQCEALSMVCLHVYGNDAAIAFAASQGNFQLNVYKPLILHHLLESMRLLGEAMVSFNRHCASGITPNESRIQFLLEQNLMLATALNPHIGYDKASQIAKTALTENLSLREAAIKQGVSAADFDAWVRVEDMVGL